MKKFSDYLKENEFVTAAIKSGPNGDFIIAQKSDNSITYFPVGNRSQGVTDIFEYNCLIADDGQAIATINQYVDVTDFVTL